MTFASKLKLLTAGATPLRWKLIPQNGAGPMIAHEFDTGKQMNPTGLRLICHMLQRGNSLEQDRANAELIVNMANHAPAISALVEKGEKLKTHLEKGWDESDEPKDIAAADAACNEFIAALNALNKDS